METWNKLLKGLAVNEHVRCNFFDVAIKFSFAGAIDVYQQQPSRQMIVTKKTVPIITLASYGIVF